MTTQQTIVVTIAADQITDWESFHSVFQKILGFPEFYGRNMDAWIDCMSCLDDPTSKMSAISMNAGELLMLLIDNAPDFVNRCPEQCTELMKPPLP